MGYFELHFWLCVRSVGYRLHEALGLTDRRLGDPNWLRLLV